MKKFTFLLFLCFFACEKAQHPIMVDDDKAIALLFDLNVANVALNKYPMHMRDSMSQVYKAQICDIHHMEVQELDTLVWQLQNDFDRYNKLYLALKDTLTDLQDELGEVKPGTEMRKYNKGMDSIRTR